MKFDNININDIIKVAISVNGIIIDTRSREKFKESHIPMAINVPIEDIEDGKISLSRNNTIIIYCESGNNSLLAARILSQNGYKVINTIGGIRQYKSSLTKIK